MKTKGILFDLDGTLMNTLEDLTDSTNYILEKNNFPKRTIEEIRSFVGNGIKKLIERAVPSETDENKINECYEDMLEYYKDHSMIKTGPYIGTKELIERLHQEGYKIAVITNKAQNSADIIVNKFFGDSVDLVIGDNKKMPLKPNPAGINKALEYFNLTKEEVVYIGDSEVDLQTGNNGEVRTILVLWGFRDKEFLQKKGGEVFANNVEELEKLIKLK
ncbi:HAD family hydrolase [Fusobacterium sp.]|uniref:HAD family hydrolase n=1 Tax=Fusobacterium sp. TaxID=68766 RepID=UPI0026150213|nr:HAD family hydrolase [Fusobacterium sp.]